LAFEVVTKTVLPVGAIDYDGGGERKALGKDEIVESPFSTCIKE
jgi:hypothetical protein